MYLCVCYIYVHTCEFIHMCLRTCVWQCEHTCVCRCTDTSLLPPVSHEVFPVSLTFKTCLPCMCPQPLKSVPLCTHKTRTRLCSTEIECLNVCTRASFTQWQFWSLFKRLSDNLLLELLAQVTSGIRRETYSSWVIKQIHRVVLPPLAHSVTTFFSLTRAHTHSLSCSF